MTISATALLAWCRERLAEGGTAASLAWLLDVGAGLERKRYHSLALHPQATVQLSRDPDELTHLWHRHLNQEPLQYLLGLCPWRDFVLTVAPGVLIPRPETELLADVAISRMKDGHTSRPALWADLGTGSGCLALALAKAFPNCHGVAVDQDPTALAVAARNLESVAGRVRLLAGNWWQPLRPWWGRLTMVVSNPPYIPTSTLAQLDPVVRCHEPPSGSGWRPRRTSVLPCFAGGCSCPGAGRLAGGGARPGPGPSPGDTLCHGRPDRHQAASGFGGQRPLPGGLHPAPLAMTPESSSPDHVLHHLGAGGVIAMPTDTLPALAARPEAAGQLWQLKERTLDKPLILMGAEPDQLWQALDIKPQAAWQQAVDHWPGALTLVVPHGGQLAQWLNPAQPISLGLRVPDHGATPGLAAPEWPPGHHQRQPLRSTCSAASGRHCQGLSPSAAGGAVPLGVPHRARPAQWWLGVPAGGSPSVQEPFKPRTGQAEATALPP